MPIPGELGCTVCTLWVFLITLLALNRVQRGSCSHIPPLRFKDFVDRKRPYCHFLDYKAGHLQFFCNLDRVEGGTWLMCPLCRADLVAEG